MWWKPSLSQRKENAYGDQSESEFQKESQITPREVKWGKIREGKYYLNLARKFSVTSVKRAGIAGSQVKWTGCKRKGRKGSAVWLGGEWLARDVSSSFSFKNGRDLKGKGMAERPRLISQRVAIWASPSLAAKNIINLISVLTIWWCPCVESSLVLLEEGVCDAQCIFFAKLY